MLPVLSDNCVPHLNQTAYQRGVSCADATFSCQETISKFIRHGDSVYSCFYDLASAFDIVEYPVLLSHLKKAGVSGKAWCLIKDWYTNVSSSVRVGRQVSPSFSVCRGVRQGSVLSPTLFLLVMDPILFDLSKRSCGPSVCGLYLGAFSHTDDIRTLSTNISYCKLRMMLVSVYASSQGMALNVNKCEASISPSLPVDSTHIHTGDLQFPLTTSAKCLGALWSPNLSCTKWVEDNIKKARCAFFARGSGVFHGTLNPLSSKSIVEHCVFPCLLFGAETWILNSTLLQKLESFQAELAKCILRLPTCTSNNTALMALQWPSMRARILIIKLCFLFKVVISDLTLSAHVFRFLAASDFESLVIIRQCCFLESIYKSNYTTAVLTSSDEITNHSLKKEILQLDPSLLVANVSTHLSQQYVQAVASSIDGSWLRLWDLSLESGVFGTTCVQAILRFLSLHAHSDGTCPAPNCSFNVDFESPCEHFLSAHTNLDISLDNFIHACTNFSVSLFSYGHGLHCGFKSVCH